MIYSKLLYKLRTNNSVYISLQHRTFILNAHNDISFTSPRSLSDMAPMKRPQRNTLFKHIRPQGGLNPNTRQQIDSRIPQIYIPHNIQHPNHNDFEHVFPSNSSSPVALTPVNGHQSPLQNQKLQPHESIGVLRGETDVGTFVLAVLAILILIVSIGSYILFRRSHNKADRASKCCIGEERGEYGEGRIELKDF